VPSSIGALVSSIAYRKLDPRFRNGGIRPADVPLVLTVNVEVTEVAAALMVSELGKN
jgi:hypothetical protein